MAYRCGDRLQMTLLPSSVEDYVGREDPVRVYDAFVEALDLKTLGIHWDPHRVGNSSYDPKSMLKLLVYGYSYGVRSSRKLEREVCHNLSFIWLVGGLKPDHKTIAEFRRQNKGALKNVLKQSVLLCLKLGLIEGHTFFTDGTKIRANAGNKQTLSREHANKLLEDLDEQIEKLLGQCEDIDGSEVEEASLVTIKKELQDQEQLRHQIREFCKQMDIQGRKQINRTDPESSMMKSRQGTHVSFNVQSTVDGKHGLIVHAEATGDCNDWHQLSEQVEKAEEVLGKKPQVCVADCGYGNVEDMERLDAQGIKVVAPTPRQVTAENQIPEPFDKSQFHYDEETDSYLCPQNQRLTFARTVDAGKHRAYQIADKTVCRGCVHFGVCTSYKYGRVVRRNINEHLMEKWEARYQEPASQEIYKNRQAKVELPFGHIKRNLKMDSFLLRGKEGASAEIGIVAACFNFARMMTLVGVPVLIKSLTG